MGSLIQANTNSTQMHHPNATGNKFIGCSEPSEKLKHVRSNMQLITGAIGEKLNKLKNVHLNFSTPILD